jgi:hypothetical protein
MYSRSATPWSKREEDNLLPWLEENSELPWIARSDAYLDQVGVKRSVESLRGKKYHILRKSRLGRVRPSRQATTSKGRGKSRRLRATSNTRCNLSSSDSISCGNVRRWLHDIPEVAPDGVKSQEPPSAEASSSGMRRSSLFLWFKAYSFCSSWIIFTESRWTRESIIFQALELCALGLWAKTAYLIRSTALVIESSGTLWVMEKSKAFQSLWILFSRGFHHKAYVVMYLVLLNQNTAQRDNMLLEITRGTPVSCR